MHLTLGDALSPLATIAIGFGAYIGPWNRRRKRRRAVEDRLYGKPAVLDRNGDIVTPEVKSIFGEILSRPVMNGEFIHLTAVVKGIDDRLTQVHEWTVEHSELHDKAFRQGGNDDSASPA